MAQQSVVTTAPVQSSNMVARPMEDDVTIWLDELKAVAAERNAVSPLLNTQPWHFSAWGFCNPISTCLTTFFCPCITIGKTHHRLHHDAQLEGYKTFNTTCLTYMCCACAFSMHPTMNIAQRGTIKRRWGLEGSFLGDCFRGFCCTCCDLMQHEKEVEYRLLRQGQGPVETEQPQMLNEEMKMPAQGGYQGGKSA